MRRALKLLKRSARYSGRFVPERRMRSDLIVVVSPKRQFSADVIESVENLLIQQLVSQTPIDGEDGPAPEKGPYTGPTLQKEHFHEPSRRGP